jgi:hypothetical protein
MAKLNAREISKVSFWVIVGGGLASAAIVAFGLGIVALIDKLG